MAAVKRDYYEVLGLGRKADPDAIKRAFHALARDWHPDVADAPDAEARFSELAEAYAVLSKREARLLYDRYGYRGRGNQGFDEAFWEARPAAATRGENVHVGIELRNFEAMRGNAPDRQVRGRCPLQGLHGPWLGRPARSGVRGLRGLGPEAHGVAPRRREPPADRAVPRVCGEACSQCGGDGIVAAERRIRLVVPPGVQDGAQLRVGGDGNDAGAGSIPGDLLVRVNVLPPPRDPRLSATRRSCSCSSPSRRSCSTSSARGLV